MSSTAHRRRGRAETENADPNVEQPPSSSSSAASSDRPRPSPPSSTSPTAAAQPARKRRRSATALHRLTKEALADCIARDELWQPCEAAEGEGDGYELGRGTGSGEPIYDDCDEIRRKISAFLRSSRMTQTAWLRLIGSNSNSYGRFMKVKGPNAGSMSGVYSGAARFESLRILEHRPKSAKRLKEEAAFGRYGRTTADFRQLRARTSDVVIWDEVRRPHVVPAGDHRLAEPFATHSF